MKLYSKNGSCSMAVHVLLNELGVDVTIEPYEENGQPNPELKKLNPRGNVPVIQDGDFHMREGGAILTWLCDEHQSELLPKNGQARAYALQWLMFANATLHPAYGRAFFIMKQADADRAALLDKVVADIQSCWDELESHLEDQDYVCGESITVADILITVIANWSPMIPKDITFGPNCKGLFRRVSERPAYQKALGEEAIEYRVAA